MQSNHYFYNCSEEYVQSIDSGLYGEITGIISELPKLSTQSEVNQNLFLQLTSTGWSFDSSPPGIDDVDFSYAGLNGIDLPSLKKRNNRSLTVTSSTLGADWHSDFAKSFNGQLVQSEVQFGKVKSKFKDFCGFRSINSREG